MTIHFDEPFLAVHWIDDGGIVWAEWKGIAGGEASQRGLDAALRLAVEKKAHRWLADTRRLGAVDPADGKWINDDWLPRAVAAGVSRMAILAPKKVVAALVVKSFMARINDRELANEYFDDIDAAWAWLRGGS